MVARIYKPSRNAMQSGKGKSENWLLEFESEAPRTTDPLMGWTSSGDTRQQLKLSFETKELAIAYADKKRPGLCRGNRTAGTCAQEVLFR